MMGSFKRQEDKEAPQRSSFRLFLGTCAFITIGGVALGMRRQIKKENFKFNIKEHGSSAVLAFKALLYGTALCAGGFAAGGVAVCQVYDIRSTEDFASLMRAKVGVLWRPSAEFKQDEMAIKGMTEQEEMDYWSKAFEENDGEAAAWAAKCSGDVASNESPCDKP